MSHKKIIIQVPAPTCPSCSQRGVTIHENLEDRLFETSEKWNMSECLNEKCKTIWLDPTPDIDSIPYLYPEYSTHKDVPAADDGRDTLKNNLISLIRNSYLYHVYKLGVKPEVFFSKFLYLLAYVHPAWRDSQDMFALHIPQISNGRFLDVGCGNGNTLINMQRRGWEVFGIDFDAKAVQNARSKNLAVSHGDLLEQRYEDNFFDGILLSHVIEHVPNPKEVINECYRILRPGGRVVMFTPNSNSWGRWIYGRHWRALETPQHLHIFSPDSLKHMAKSSRFRTICSFSSPSGDSYVFSQSSKLKTKERIDPFDYKVADTISGKIKWHLVWFLRGIVNVFFRDKNETCVLICIK